MLQNMSLAVWHMHNHTSQALANAIKFWLAAEWNCKKLHLVARNSRKELRCRRQTAFNTLRAKHNKWQGTRIPCSYCWLHNTSREFEHMKCMCICTGRCTSLQPLKEVHTGLMQWAQDRKVQLLNHKAKNLCPYSQQNFRQNCLAFMHT